MPDTPAALVLAEDELDAIETVLRAERLRPTPKRSQPIGAVIRG